LDSQENVGFLVDEYRTLFGETGPASTKSVEDLLMNQGDWTAQAAEHLAQLARNYGSFMLRNALAISLALGIEDGDLGF
jgi:hypothetical protein